MNVLFFPFAQAVREQRRRSARYPRLCIFCFFPFRREAGSSFSRLPGEEFGASFLFPPLSGSGFKGMGVKLSCPVGRMYVRRFFSSPMVPLWLIFPFIYCWKVSYFRTTRGRRGVLFFRHRFLPSAEKCAVLDPFFSHLLRRLRRDLLKTASSSSFPFFSNMRYPSPVPQGPTPLPLGLAKLIAFPPPPLVHTSSMFHLLFFFFVPKNRVALRPLFERRSAWMKKTRLSRRIKLSRENGGDEGYGLFSRDGESLCSCCFSRPP